MDDITKRIHDIIYKVPYQVYVLLAILALFFVGQSIDDYVNQDTSYRDYLMARDFVYDNQYIDQNPNNHPKGGLVYEINITPSNITPINIEVSK